MALPKGKWDFFPMGQCTSVVYDEQTQTIFCSTRLEGVNTILRDDRVVNIGIEHGLPHELVGRVILHDGDIFCGTDAGLVVVDRQAFTDVAQGKANPQVFKKPTGQLYESFSRALAELKHDWIFDMRSRCGNLHVCNLAGFWILNKDIGARRIWSGNGLVHDWAFNANFIHGRWWISTEGGISVLSPNGSLLRNITIESGLPHSHIAAIEEYQEDIWIVSQNWYRDVPSEQRKTRAGAVSKLNLSTYTFTHYINEEFELGSGELPLSLHTAYDGTLWILGRGGVKRFDGAAGKIIDKFIPGDYPSILIWKIYCLNDSIYLTGTAGVFRFTPDQ